MNQPNVLLQTSSSQCMDQSAVVRQLITILRMMRKEMKHGGIASHPFYWKAMKKIFNLVRN